MSVSKSIKPILIAAIAVAVLAVALVMLLVVFPDKNTNDAAASTEANEQPVDYVIKEDGDSLAEMKAYYSDGTTLTVDYTKNENGDVSYSVDPAPKYFEYNTSKFRSMMFTLTSLNAVDIVEEEPSDLSQYGLDNPQFRMEMTFQDGRKINLYIGDQTPVGNYYYAMTDQSKMVYTIGNYITSLIMRTELKYRDIKTFPSYTDEDIYTNINWVRLTERNGTEIELKMDSDFSMSENKASSMYMMLSPVVSSCTDEDVQSKVLDIVSKVSYEDIVGDITKDDFSSYGLDDPARLEMSDISGNTLDIVIGSEVNGTYYYVVMGDQYDAYMNGDTDSVTVILYAPEAFDWLNLDYTTLLNRAVWIQDIHSIESIDYDLDGTAYTMALEEYDDVTKSGTAVVRTVGTINGKSITESNTKRIFSRTLNLREVGQLDTAMDYGEPQYTITLNLRDGTSRKIELMPMNDRQYACSVDGVAKFYIYKSNIDNLVTAIQRVMDDRNVSLVYTN